MFSSAPMTRSLHPTRPRPSGPLAFDAKAATGSPAAGGVWLRRARDASRPPGEKPRRPVVVSSAGSRPAAPGSGGSAQLVLLHYFSLVVEFTVQTGEELRHRVQEGGATAHCQAGHG